MIVTFPLPTDWPGTISLSDSGPVDVIEKIESVSITCTADCQPNCGYVWTDANGTVVSTEALLNIATVTRYQSAGSISVLLITSMGRSILHLH